MQKKSLNSHGTLSDLSVGGKSFQFFNVSKIKGQERLPYSIRILLENLLRREDGVIVKKSDIDAVLKWQPKAEPDQEIQFMPARIVLQDFTGVPCVADLASMRDAIARLGGDPNRVNPWQPADLVIDHSVQVDFAGSKDAFQKNSDLEFKRNRERYEFLRWGQSAFRNFRVVPPETGIVHQVNLEYLASLAMQAEHDGKPCLIPDTLIGTDSHTTMINGLGVVGWGVGGIEAEAAMLGQPVSMLIPQVVGFRLTGKLSAGVTATDLVLTVTEMLRKKGVVGKFVEFCGAGLKNLRLADRATIANMAPEYGATIGIFPVDELTMDYLKLTGRTEDAERAEAYFKATGLWWDPSAKEAEYSDLLTLDLADVEPSLAGPSRPQDRVGLKSVADNFQKSLPTLYKKTDKNPDPERKAGDLEHGSVVIAAITSCTNTSNPSGLITAGLLAKKAVALGLQARPWVKCSLAPGSKVVTDYLDAAGLTAPLEALRFHLVGYGCTTCIGNSGPLPKEIEDTANEANLVIASVLSGNRNFEGRVHPNVRANYLASPALVVAYALAGSVKINLTKDALGEGKNGPVFLKDVWPTPAEVEAEVKKHVTGGLFKKSYADVFQGDHNWQAIKVPKGENYQWDKKSTYIKAPPFFDDVEKEPKPITDIRGARVLAFLGDSITTDHISPAGDIDKKGPAAKYLTSLGVDPRDFNSFGARRGNHEVMMRGTFANVRLKNELVPGIEGGVTVYNGKQMSIYDAAMEYQAKKTPLVVIAGKEYGTGSSRDWAAKGTRLLGVRAVIAESFERIHRSNLVGMGVLPLQFVAGQGRKSLGLTGSETFEINGLASLKVGQTVKVSATNPDGKTTEFEAVLRIDTPNELEYYRHGGILPYVLRQALKNG